MAAVSCVADRLVSRGHRRIAAIRPSLGLNVGYLFLSGYRHALKRHGIEDDPDLVETALARRHFGAIGRSSDVNDTAPGSSGDRAATG